MWKCKLKQISNYNDGIEELQTFQNLKKTKLISELLKSKVLAFFCFLVVKRKKKMFHFCFKGDIVFDFSFFSNKKAFYCANILFVHFYFFDGIEIQSQWRKPLIFFFKTNWNYFFEFVFPFSLFKTKKNKKLNNKRAKTQK